MSCQAVQAATTSMEKVKELFERSERLKLVLFLCSFGIYFLYYHEVFFHLNSLLSSITADSLKNYYTYLYHAKHGSSFLHFQGMNHPFGEHVIYPDCQPIIAGVLQVLPFTHDYLIGILHGLIFLSFIVTPGILFRIFQRLGLDAFSSFFISLAIALLSPQFMKISGGHFALAYGCLIPYWILLVLKCIVEKKRGHLVQLFIINVLLFLLHAYLGFCLALFSFLSLFFYELLTFQKARFFKNSLYAFLAGVCPLPVFKLFMLLTDQHANRTVKPYGAEVMIENLDSLLSPSFGPLQKITESVFTHKPGHFEGHTYLGIATILLALAFLLGLPFFYKSLRIKKELLALLFASLCFLFLSFGYHLKLLELLHIESASLNQFRALCRFSWIFYFVFPIFLADTLYHTFQQRSTPSKFARLSFVTVLLLFGLNMLEAHSFLAFDRDVFWNYTNFFNEELLKPQERTLMQHIRAQKMQAILPLPVYSVGSEVYDRYGADYSMLPSMLYSYHTGLPVISGAMSRTSITETEDLVNILNSYKKENPGLGRLNDAPLLVIQTNGPLMADEDRLLKFVKPFHKNDSLSFGVLSKNDLQVKKLEPARMYIADEKPLQSQQLVFIPQENRKPFLPARMQDSEIIYTLDSNRFESGTYVVSFHYYYSKKIYNSFDVQLVLNKLTGGTGGWEQMRRVSALSGFYPGFAVMEHKVELEKNSRYEFMFFGSGETEYHISHFMIRPQHSSVISTKGKDTLYNNFPD